MDISTSSQLKSVELKVTGPRKAVLEILASSTTPLDADDIKKQLHDKKIRADQATIYRILKAFTDKEILKKVSLQEGKMHYELADRPHHHHIICTSCGRIEDIETCGIEDMEKTVSNVTGFTIHSHSFELFGFCPRCSKGKK